MTPYVKMNARCVIWRAGAHIALAWDLEVMG